MLIFHKFVDVLRGASKDAPLLLPDEVTEHEVRVLVDRIIDAEKFDFGELVLEPDPKDPGVFALPALAPIEREAWCEGLLPLPAPVCWYEFTLAHIRSALLVSDLGGCRWRMNRFNWPKPGHHLIYDGHEVALDRDRTSAALMQVTVNGGRAVAEMAKVHPATARLMYTEQPFLALYLTLMINSSSTELRRERAPKNLNEARVKKGRTPLADHRVVTIVPERYLRQSRLEAGLTRLPPRLHKRRSHIRTLHRGEPNQRRILIPQCWVMLASEAEVSHEYRIGGAKK